MNNLYEPFPCSVCLFIGHANKLPPHTVPKCWRNPEFMRLDSNEAATTTTTTAAALAAVMTIESATTRLNEISKPMKLKNKKKYAKLDEYFCSHRDWPFKEFLIVIFRGQMFLTWIYFIFFIPSSSAVCLVLPR